MGRRASWRGNTTIDDQSLGHDAVWDHRDILAVRLDADGSPVHLHDHPLSEVANRDPIADMEGLV